MQDLMRNLLLGGGGGFSPQSLFTGGVEGALYDPSDLSTLYQDSAGTTPVTGVEQVVGLMLDKSKNLALGPQTELVTNGTFNTDIAGWTFTGGGGSAAWNAGTARITGTSSVSKQFSQGISVVAGKSYTITGTVTPVSGTLSASLTLRTTNDVATSAFIAGQGFSASGGTVNFKYVAPTTTTVFVCIQSFATISTFDIDNISIVEWIQGNHATSTGSARPTLSARVNLLEYSEQFDNGYWTKNNAAVATTTATTDPLGGTTAEKFTPNNGALTNPTASVISSQTTETRTFSCYMKAAEYTKGFLRIGGNSGGTAPIAVYDLTGSGYVISSQGASVTASINTAGNGWYRCVINYLNGNGTSGTAYAPNIGATSDVYSVGTTDITVTANGTSGIYIWGADLRPANIGVNIPSYQRIAAATDYDTNGFPFYLSFGGAQSMSTPANLDLTSTDKVTVYAGVRKLSDAAGAIVAELSVDANTNNGAFFQNFPRGSTFNEPMFASRGTLIVNSGQNSNAYPAPITNVLTGIGNISGDIAQQRINGVVFGTGTADQGTGNFGTYPLFIGSRNNASSFLTGYLYSLIIQGAAASATQLASTEAWVNQKTKAY